jgi:hypothetical protein
MHHQSEGPNRLGPSLPSDRPYSGGCQCGAVRFSCDPPRDRASVCFCRMCQKASGQPFMAFVRFRADQVHWSKPPDIFKSSNMVERGFCAACGTPLTWRRIDGPYISLTLNSLDHPERVLPEMRFSAGSAPAWCHALADLPTREMDLTKEPGFVGYQHRGEI